MMIFVCSRTKEKFAIDKFVQLLWTNVFYFGFDRNKSMVKWTSSTASWPTNGKNFSRWCTQNTEHYFQLTGLAKKSIGAWEIGWSV